MLNEQVENVMAIAFELARIREEHGAQSGMYLSEVKDLRAEVTRLAAQSAPTEPTVTKDQRELIAKLRYMGKQYAGGQVARGGAPQKHYLEEAADEIEMMAWALSMKEKTPGSAQENADLRNVIQAACIDGIPGLERAWAKYFPDNPITVAQSAPLAQQAREYPPLPEATCQVVTIDMVDGRKARVIRAIDPHWMVGADGKTLFATDQLRAYVDADRAAAQVEPTSMPSSEWLEEAERIAGEFTVAVANGESAAAALAYSNLRAHLSKRVTADEVRMLTNDERKEVMDRRMNDYDGTENIAVMLQRAFCRVNAGRVIPADGEVRS